MTDISALEAKEKIKDKLFAIPGVVGVGISSGSGDFLNIYVKQMTDELKEELPSEVNGLPVRVIEVGDIRALQRTGKMRPARPGISIGHIGITAGNWF